MATKVIVSYDGSDNDHDALALGRLLAAAGAELSLAYVRHSRAPDQSHESEEQHDAEKLLAGGAEWLGQPGVPQYVVVSASTPEGLRDLAERIGASVVVFGPEYRTAPGHVDPQTSARTLMPVISTPCVGFGRIVAATAFGSAPAQQQPRSMR